MDWFRLLQPDNLALLIPIVAIIMGVIYAITMAVIHHRERMAMIERGIHPDSRQPNQAPRP